MSKSKMTYEDDFEMLMVRHEYLSKVKNPNPEWMKKFEPTVKVTARIMFDKLRYNFVKVGYDLEDIIMITNCYMLGYMEIYSLERNSKAKAKIVTSYLKKFDREPTEIELDKKEKINLISFLRQRLQHASVVCARKARNIVVGKDVRATFAFTEASLPASDEMILEKGEKMGYRKVTKDELKQIKLNARVKQTKDLFDKDGFGIIQIEVLNDGITEHDYQGIFINSRDDVYHQTPEESYLSKEESKDMSAIFKEFGDMSVKAKKKLLKVFILNNRTSLQYKQEIGEARRMLKTL